MNISGLHCFWHDTVSACKLDVCFNMTVLHDAEKARILLISLCSRNKVTPSVQNPRDVFCAYAHNCTFQKYAHAKMISEFRKHQPKTCRNSYARVLSLFLHPLYLSHSIDITPFSFKVCLGYASRERERDQSILKTFSK